jgi:microcystin-dependent protein
MPVLSITKTYQDGDILTEADLDNIRESVEGFFNTTGIDSDNIQAGGVGVSDIGINDDQYLEFGTGNDGAIGVAASNKLIIKNVTTDTDIDVQVSPGAVLTTAMTIKGSTGKVVGLADPDLSVGGSAVNVTTLKQFMPVGIILPYSKTTAPTGFLLCDGSAVSRTTYSDLFAAIASTAGQGNGATTFNVPDLRGRFIRGWDNAAGRDPDAATRTAINTGGNTGDNIFSLQDEEFKAHTHNQTDNVSGTGTGAIQPVGGNSAVNTGSRATSSTGGNETRPKNVNVNFIIKY